MFYGARSFCHNMSLRASASTPFATNLNSSMHCVHSMRVSHPNAAGTGNWQSWNNMPLCCSVSYTRSLKCKQSTTERVSWNCNSARSCNPQIACRSCTHENACYALPTGAKVCPSFPSNWNCKGNRRGFFANILWRLASLVTLPIKISIWQLNQLSVQFARLLKSSMEQSAIATRCHWWWEARWNSVNSSSWFWPACLHACMQKTEHCLMLR